MKASVLSLFVSEGISLHALKNLRVNVRPDQAVDKVKSSASGTSFVHLYSLQL